MAILWRQCVSATVRRMEPITALGSLFFFVIFIITLISILRSSHGLLGKFLWILVAFFLSFVGSILWFFFGRTKK